MSEINQAKASLKKYKAIASILNQDGGKILLASLQRDIVNGIDNICSLYKAPDLDLRASILKLKSSLDLWRVLKRAPKNAKLYEEEMLKLMEDQDEESEV